MMRSKPPSMRETWGGVGGGVGGCRLHRRLDLKLVPYDAYHFATLHFTGSDVHNTALRKRAIELGMKLSEYSLVTAGGGEPVGAVRSESDIFHLLKMEYVPPEQR